MITVKQLIEKLSQYHKDAIIIIAKDTEGNGYSPLLEIEPGYYEPETSYSGGVWDEKDEGNQDCLILYPVN